MLLGVDLEQYPDCVERIIQHEKGVEFVAVGTYRLATIDGNHIPQTKERSGGIQILKLTTHRHGRQNDVDTGAPYKLAGRQFFDCGAGILDLRCIAGNSNYDKNRIYGIGADCCVHVVDVIPNHTPDTTQQVCTTYGAGTLPLLHAGDTCAGTVIGTALDCYTCGDFLTIATILSDGRCITTT
eukprot:Lankesteria_metandrocarpae@DN10425_c0_g1_i1.p1